MRLVDILVEMGGNPHVDDDIDFLVEDLFRQTKGGHLGADEAAGLFLIVVEVDLVAKRQQVAGDGQRGRATADQGDFFTVFFTGDLGQTVEKPFCCRRPAV